MLPSFLRWRCNGEEGGSGSPTTYGAQARALVVLNAKRFWPGGSVQIDKGGDASPGPGCIAAAHCMLRALSASAAPFPRDLGVWGAGGGGGRISISGGLRASVFMELLTEAAKPGPILYRFPFWGG